MTWLRVLLLALAALCAVSDAAGHASLLASTLADGAALRQAPLEIVLEFDEPVAPLAMRLIDDEGAPLALAGDVRAKGTTVRVALPALRGGAFVFSYRVASADSHPVAGSIAFTVGEGIHLPHGAAAAAMPLTSGSEAMVIAARAVRDLLLLIACGAALFAVMVGAFPHQRAVLCTAGFGAALASVAELCLQGAVLAGQNASSRAAFRAVAATTAGLSSAAICGAAAAIVLGAWAWNPVTRKALLLLGAIGAAAGVALTGHAASAQPSWLSMPLVAGHALVAAFWLGSLVALRLSMSIDTAGLARALRRFSVIAIPAVAILVATGTAFAAIQLDAWRDLRESPYGNLVVIKAVLLVTLLVIAACNRFIMTPRLEHGDACARVWLRRTITGELMLMTLVVAVTSVLSRTPPHPHAAITRELAGAASYSGSVTVSPARAGRNLVVVCCATRMVPRWTRLSPRWCWSTGAAALRRSSGR